MKRPLSILALIIASSLSLYAESPAPSKPDETLIHVSPYRGSVDGRSQFSRDRMLEFTNEAIGIIAASIEKVSSAKQPDPTRFRVLESGFVDLTAIHTALSGRSHVGKLLPDGVSLFEYVELADSKGRPYWNLVVYNKSLEDPHTLRLAPVSEIVPHLDNLYLTWNGPSPVMPSADLAALYNRLVAPGIIAAPGSHSHIIFSAYGSPLEAVPWAMLIDQQGFLIESRAVATINHPKDILIQDIAAPSHMIDVLSPSLSLPIAYSQENRAIEQIAQRHRWSYQLIPARATGPIKLNAAGLAAGVVHISTHSLKATDPEGVSTVYLAFENSSGVGQIDHQLLPITRIANFPLQGNYLLNLSSCGTWDKSEVIIDPRSPLSPAYIRDMVLHAGGQHVLFGLWGIEESGAFQVNQQLYRDFFSGLSLMDAFQSAMAKTITSLRGAGLSAPEICSRIGGLTLGVSGHLHTGDFQSASIVSNARETSLEELFASSSKINQSTTRNSEIEALRRHEFFTIGSTSQDVLAVMGEPTRKDSHRWYYGTSYVEFSRTSPGLLVSSFVQGNVDLKARLLGETSRSPSIWIPTFTRTP